MFKLTKKAKWFLELASKENTWIWMALMSDNCSFTDKVPLMLCEVCGEMLRDGKCVQMKFCPCIVHYTCAKYMLDQGLGIHCPSCFREQRPGACSNIDEPC